MHMKEKLVTGALLLALVTMASSAVAAPVRISGQLNTPGTQKTLILPAAADHSPVISLGAAVDPTSRKMVEGYAIIHYAKGGNGGGHGGSGSGTVCYAFMSKGAVWKTVEPWVVNPANDGGLPSSFPLPNITSNIAKWEDAADGTLGNNQGVNILGDGSETSDPLDADLDAPDGRNEVYFADVSTPGAIAVTIVWGIFGGPPQGRELVEWDQVYDDADYAWSTSGEANKMDFENISTHELGHSIGLDDLYNSTCAEQTMYGYADFGETNKQTLESGDIMGADKLY